MQCALDVSIFSGKPEVHPKSHCCKNTFQNCNPPDFKFYLGKVNVNFESVFTAINNTKMQRNGPGINITRYGEVFISKLTEIKLKHWRVTVLKRFFTAEKF